MVGAPLSSKKMYVSVYTILSKKTAGFILHFSIQNIEVSCVCRINLYYSIYVGILLNMSDLIYSTII